jgi:hypothetical protein
MSLGNRPMLLFPHQNVDGHPVPRGGACARNLALQVSILAEPHGSDRLPYVRLMMLRLELRFGPCSAGPSGPASPLVVWCLTRLKTACWRQLDRLAAIYRHADLPGKPRTSSAPSIPTSSTDVEHGEIRPGGDLRVESLLPGRNHGSSEQVFDQMDASQNRPCESSNYHIIP